MKDFADLKHGLNFEWCSGVCKFQPFLGARVQRPKDLFPRLIRVGKQECDATAFSVEAMLRVILQSSLKNHPYARISRWNETYLVE